jgi:hypothetical protein
MMKYKEMENRIIWLEDYVKALNERIGKLEDKDRMNRPALINGNSSYHIQFLEQ